MLVVSAERLLKSETLFGPSPRRHLSLFWIATLIVMGFIVYASGFTIRYYGDDFFLFYEYVDWWHAGRYRPATSIVVETIQGVFGLNPVPLHVLQLLLHISLSYLVFQAARMIGLSRAQAVVASLFMLISQANAFALLSNCTLSQVGGTVFGYFSIWLACVAFTNYRGTVFALGLLSFAVALFFKESSAAFIALLPLAFLASSWGSCSKRSYLLSRAALHSAAYVAVLLVYLVMRHASPVLPITVGTGSRYDLHFGLNIIKNAALLSLAAVTPVSTVTIYELWSESRAELLGIALIAIALCMALIVVGLFRVSKRLSIVLSVFAGLSVAPLLLLNHVSELYVYNAMPPVSLLIGAGVGRLISDHRIGIKAISAFASIMILTCHVVAIQQKAQLMRANGDRADAMLAQIVAHASVAPYGAIVRLENRPGDRGYSIFVMREDFGVVEHAGPVIRGRAQRPDITVQFVRTESAATEETLSSPVLTLRTDGECVIAVRRGSSIPPLGAQASSLQQGSNGRCVEAPRRS